MPFNNAGPMSRRRYRQVDFLYLVKAVASSRTIICSVAHDKIIVNCVTNTTYTVPANARPLCDSEVPIYNLPNLNTILRLVQPADRCLIQVAPMSLVACSTVPRQLTMTLQALLEDALMETR